MAKSEHPPIGSGRIHPFEAKNGMKAALKNGAYPFNIAKNGQKHPRGKPIMEGCTLGYFVRRDESTTFQNSNLVVD